LKEQTTPGKLCSRVAGKIRLFARSQQKAAGGTGAAFWRAESPLLRHMNGERRLSESCQEIFGAMRIVLDNRVKFDYVNNDNYY